MMPSGIYWLPWNAPKPHLIYPGQQTGCSRQFVAKGVDRWCSMHSTTSVLYFEAVGMHQSDDKAPNPSTPLNAAARLAAKQAILVSLC
jgi:hypothetical protein